MKLRISPLQSIEQFLIEFVNKKFSDDEIRAWAMFNLPYCNKDSFSFFHITLKNYFIATGGNYMINSELVNDVWKKYPDFLKKFNDALRVEE